MGLDNVLLNIAGTNEHVPEVKRVIHTIKERNHTLSWTSFSTFPVLLKRAMIKKEVAWMNVFNHDDSVSATLSPRTIVIRSLQVDFTFYRKVPNGAYHEVRDEPSPSDSETSRSTPAIALNPTSNLQGSYHLMSLGTRKQLTRK